MERAVVMYHAGDEQHRVAHGLFGRNFHQLHAAANLKKNHAWQSERRDQLQLGSGHRRMTTARCSRAVVIGG
jgi:hypothetical protein